MKSTKINVVCHTSVMIFVSAFSTVLFSWTFVDSSSRRTGECWYDLNTWMWIHTDSWFRFGVYAGILGWWSRSCPINMWKWHKNFGAHFICLYHRFGHIIMWILWPRCRAVAHTVSVNIPQLNSDDRCCPSLNEYQNMTFPLVYTTQKYVDI